MTQELVIFQDGDDDMQLPAAFSGSNPDINEDLAAGVGGSYGILSMKGSRFQVKWQGSSTILTNPQTGDPIGSFQAVIIKGNHNINKQYYAQGYTEGDAAPPDCYSLDGKTPDPRIETPQHSNCATCPKNVFGSRINAATGAKSKACADSRKLAVSPIGDIDNALLGGPMMFRVPATALRDLATFSDTLKARGYPYNSVVARIGFDTAVSYPKPTFKAVRVLTEKEAKQVLKWYKSEHVDKVLGDFSPADSQKAPEVADSVFEEPPLAAPTAPAKAIAKSVVPPPPPRVAAAKAVPQPAAPVAAKTALPGRPRNGDRKAPATPLPPKIEPLKAVDEKSSEEDDTTTEITPGNLDQDIANILAELNSISSE